MLKVENLNVYYGAIHALKNVTMNVKEGTITAILGANGAGKSTLLKTISGLIQPQSGDLSYNDLNLTKIKPHQIAQRGIVHVPEGRRIFGELTVLENLKIGAFVQPKQPLDEQLSTIYALFPILKERSNQQASLLSGGEQQMLAIGRGLMARPKVLILDEPSLGLAPLIIKTIFETLKELNKQGMTILIVEQNALQTLKIADYAYVLQVGNIIKHNTASNLQNDPELVEAYLGKS